MRQIIQGGPEVIGQLEISYFGRKILLAEHNIQGDPFEKFTDERPCTKETTGQKNLKLGM